MPKLLLINFQNLGKFTSFFFSQKMQTSFCIDNVTPQMLPHKMKAVFNSRNTFIKHYERLSENNSMKS